MSLGQQPEEMSLRVGVQRSGLPIVLLASVSPFSLSLASQPAEELPEALYDYLYDFGFLGKLEEESYVQSMVDFKFQDRRVPSS